MKCTQAIGLSEYNRETDAFCLVVELLDPLRDRRFFLFGALEPAWIIQNIGGRLPRHVGGETWRSLTRLDGTTGPVLAGPGL